MTALLPVSHSSWKYKGSIPRKHHSGFINTFTTGKKLSGRRQNEAAIGTHTWAGCCCWYYHCRTLPAPWGEICQEICCNNPAPGSGLISSHSGLSNEAKNCQLFKLYDIPAFLRAGKAQQGGSWELPLLWDCCEHQPPQKCVGQDEERIQQSKISCLGLAWGHCCSKFFIQCWSETMWNSGCCSALV